VVVSFHGVVPVVDDGIDYSVENGEGDNVTLGDTSFSWEGEAKDALLLGYYHKGLSEIREKLEDVIVNAIFLEKSESAVAVKSIVSFQYINEI